jgi:DinB family
MMNSILEEALDAWSDTRRGVIDEVMNIPAGKFDFRPADEVRTVAEKGTRLAWLCHGISHEMYHRGQLALYQRLLGIEPALTKRIRRA